MAFIVKKKIYGKEYYYLNENKRVDGKVKTKTLAYLGKTRKGAEKKMKDILEGKEKSEKPKKKEIKKVKLIHKEISIEELASFCKRKGFVYQSSEIYGGFAGFWDFGPLGVELFNNLKKEWWNYFVQIREDVVGIDASIISHPRTWKASGHIEGFKDIAVVCKQCKKSTKLELNEFGKIKCDCGGDYEKTGVFDMLFKTEVGALDKDVAYLRGETAQSMFMDFKLICQTSRMKLPLGVAQIGRCFRNEIAPRDFLFRSREFHIGEFEFFVNPEEKKCNILTKKHLGLNLNFLNAETQKDGKNILKETTIGKMLSEKRLEEWHAYWLAEQILWFKSLGLNEIKIREHTETELSHYSSATFDIDYNYHFGSEEVAGNANRGQYDLIQHKKESKQKMEIFDEKTGEKVLPKVIEPTFGMERIFLALLTKAYSKNKKGEIVLRLPVKLSPVKAAIFPIVKKKEFEKIARKIFFDLKRDFNVSYDESGSVGKRYARNDEIGTPYCITVDGDSLKNKDITVRWRDSSKQVRIKIDKLKESLRRAINGEDILKFGKLVK
jgi:glycyl-tRNA synthetase|tara:strand:- start:6828 stop:8483 length:1656 start_codon:yes stop_codon:yes gene_type:complete